MNEYNLTRGLWWTILVLAILLMLTSCTRKVYIPVEHKTIQTVTLHDTVVQVRLDQVRDSVVTPDTVNRLENKYAVSYAEYSHGMLHHSLNTKDVSIPVSVQYVEKEIQKEIPQPYPVEVIKIVEKELNWWQRLTMWVGGFVIVAGTIGIIGYLLYLKK